MRIISFNVNGIRAAAKKDLLGSIEHMNPDIIGFQETKATPDQVRETLFGIGHPVLHADLYRLAGEDEVEELGLFDAPDAIVLVEWPERAPSLAGRADVVVRLSVPPGGDGRNADITFRDGRPFV